MVKLHGVFASLREALVFSPANIFTGSFLGTADGSLLPSCKSPIKRRGIALQQARVLHSAYSRLLHERRPSYFGKLQHYTTPKLNYYYLLLSKDSYLNFVKQKPKYGLLHLRYLKSLRVRPALHRRLALLNQSLTYRQ